MPPDGEVQDNRDVRLGGRHQGPGHDVRSQVDVESRVGEPRRLPRATMCRRPSRRIGGFSGQEVSSRFRGRSPPRRTHPPEPSRARTGAPVAGVPLPSCSTGHSRRSCDPTTHLATPLPWRRSPSERPPTASGGAGVPSPQPKTARSRGGSAAPAALACLPAAGAVSAATSALGPESSPAPGSLRLVAPRRSARRGAGIRRPPCCGDRRAPGACRRRPSRT